MFYGAKSFKGFTVQAKVYRAHMSLGSCVAFYNGIESFCQHLRDEFDTIEKDGLKLTTCIQKTYASQNKRKRKTKKTFDYEGEDTGCTTALEDAREFFRIGTYLPIINTLIAEVRRRKSVYCILQQNFNFLLNLNTWAINDIENVACKLLKLYASDLDSDFPSEVVHFAFHLRSSPDLGPKPNTAQAQLLYLKKNCLFETFPNVAIILRIYLTLSVANTEGERSFLALKRVKNYLRSSLTQDHVCDFCIMAIEKSFTKSMSFRILLIKLQQRNAENTSCNTLSALAFFCVALSVLFIFGQLMKQCENFILYLTF